MCPLRTKGFRPLVKSPFFSPAKPTRGESSQASQSLASLEICTSPFPTSTSFLRSGTISPAIMLSNLIQCSIIHFVLNLLVVSCPIETGSWTGASAQRDKAEARSLFTPRSFMFFFSSITHGRNTPDPVFTISSCAKSLNRSRSSGRAGMRLVPLDRRRWYLVFKLLMLGLYHHRCQVGTVPTKCGQKHREKCLSFTVDLCANQGAQKVLWRQARAMHSSWVPAGMSTFPQLDWLGCVVWSQ